ncbi:endonuclease domain-containing 1 protein-like [Corythoichthys intestinalis]|uniref:endonuclease domain-containing 1 protein-like n=1 Tax=Corythoichthys intestinalis TaxID=161448 RepID=UPI0025A55E34|nr:endonuclease domain-containing 1 protein-like [Corythoichthys intestinalis]XP_061793091.1 endonuclease domain-containing 1 protein-like [Nerophis lumbriciformis]
MSHSHKLCAFIGASFLLLSWCDFVVLGELHQDFSKCLDFFHRQTPPKGVIGAGYQPICQRFENQYRFATMYHREHRTPLYSAYIISSADGKRPNCTWMYEPQLAFSLASPEMKPFSTPVDQNVQESQAVLQDYKNSNYTRGHLNPSMHQKTRKDRIATFTLTNVVPQRAGSNSGPWNSLEKEVLRKFKAFCEGPMYVITGAMPYANETHWINNRMSVPEYMWSAYCCPVYKAKIPKDVRPLFPTYAAVGRNDRDSGEEIVPVNPKVRTPLRGYDVRKMPLDTLEGILAQRLHMPISLFEGKCQ